MMTFTLYLLMLTLLSALLLMVGFLFALSHYYSRESLSPFECGFDPIKKARSPFSLRFFLIVVLFLVFDIEIAILLPLTIIPLFHHMSHFMLTINLFLAILIIGLFHEWKEGSISWSIQ